MDGGPDERVRSGACPLCEADVPTTQDETRVLPILAHHFSTTCEATRFDAPGPLLLRARR